MDIAGTLFPKMQVLMTEDILDGRRFKTPYVVSRGKPHEHAKLEGL